MEHKRVSLAEIKVPPGGDISFGTDLIRFVSEHGWDAIPPVPLVPIPLEWKTGNEIYFYSDGCHRLDAARRTGSPDIDAIIYGPDDDPKEVGRLTGDGAPPSYDEALLFYQRFYLHMWH